MKPYRHCALASRPNVDERVHTLRQILNSFWSTHSYETIYDSTNPPPSTDEAISRVRELSPLKSDGAAHFNQLRIRAASTPYNLDSNRFRIMVAKRFLQQLAVIDLEITLLRAFVRKNDKK